jgi:4-oxalocrotonate tautomerase
MPRFGAWNQRWTLEVGMPMITIQYASAHSLSVSRADIVAAVAELEQSILHKDPNVTAMLVEERAPEDWFIAGRSLAETGKAAFWLDIRVTDGTNTKDEKAAFVAAAFKAFGELLGPLDNECYVHVDDARGDAYGYGGLTQERRYIAAKLAAGDAR